MRKTNKLMWIGGLALLALTAHAQTNTAPVSPSLPDLPLPQTPAEFWGLAIGVLTPFIVTGVYKLVPKIPGWMLPASTPLIGLALGYLAKYAGAHLTGFDMAKAGALAVFVREVFNQAVTKRIASAASAAPPSAPAPAPAPAASPKT